MKIPTIEVKARELGDIALLEDYAFIFLPAENRFVLLDGYDIEEDTVTIYFEPNANPKSWQSIVFPIEVEVTVALVKSSTYDLNR